MYKKRFYRTFGAADDLRRFEVKYYETDVLISARSDVHEVAAHWVKIYHAQIRDYIDAHPEFATSLVPLALDPAAPHIVRTMMRAAQKAGVGPMAAVAGAIAEFVGKKLLAHTPEVIVENGGDIFLRIQRRRRIGIFAGPGNPYNRIGLIIDPRDTPCGVCTSSGTIGHSLSFGRTNATVVIAGSAAVADGFATALGNLVNGPEDVETAIKFARRRKIIRGGIIIINDTMSAYGKIRLDVLDKTNKH
ncbi:MAG: UPF0280 family protein [Candidatus Omnitrophica bacterium]|nr:UPF0280 family protein [Candidatus Omnitrophota bacterium]